MMFETVKISLFDGKITEELELKPSVGALLELQAKYENFQALISRVGSLNFTSYVDTIMAGLYPAKNISRANVENSVFATGMVDLLPPLIKFISILINGGKSPKQEEATSTDPEAS